MSTLRQFSNFFFHLQTDHNNIFFVIVTTRFSSQVTWNYGEMIAKKVKLLSQMTSSLLKVEYFGS